MLVSYLRVFTVTPQVRSKAKITEEAEQIGQAKLLPLPSPPTSLPLPPPPSPSPSPPFPLGMGRRGEVAIF